MALLGEAGGTLRRSWALRPLSRPRLPLVISGYCLLYFLAAKVGIATSLPPEGVVVIWPPNAILLMVLLAVERRSWWAFFLATVATEIVAGFESYPLWAATGYGIVNFAEAAIAATLLAKFGKGDPPDSGLQGFVRFLAIGPFLASGMAALLGAAIYKIGAPEIDYLRYWRVFWFGDALGLLIVGTSLLAFRRRPLRLTRPLIATIVEMLTLGFGLTGALYWALFNQSAVPNVYLLLPFLLWAAIRFGSHGANAAVLATVSFTIASASARVGPFAELAAIDVVVSLQGLNAIVAISTFFVAITIEDFWRTQEALKDALRDKEVLLYEVNHRVKNSLQLVNSILLLQSSKLTDPGAQAGIMEARQKVEVIAGLHQNLYTRGVHDRVDLAAAIEGIAKAAVATAAGDNPELVLNYEGHRLIHISRASPLLLAVNELVTNAVKYGLTSAHPRLEVTATESSGDLTVVVADNGPGIIGDGASSSGVGSEIVRALVSQLRASLAITNGEPGAIFTIKLRVGTEGRDPPPVGAAA